MSTSNLLRNQHRSIKSKQEIEEGKRQDKKIGEAATTNSELPSFLQL